MLTSEIHYRLHPRYHSQTNVGELAIVPEHTLCDHQMLIAFLIRNYHMLRYARLKVVEFAHNTLDRFHRSKCSKGAVFV